MEEPTLVPIDEKPIEGIDDKKSMAPVPKGMTLSIVKESKLSPEQIMAIRARTPKALTKPLKGRGGKELTYVPIAIYIRKLNFVFGYGGWTHEITNRQLIEDHALVEGKLTIISTGQVVMQYGGHPLAREIIAYEKDGKSISPWQWNKLKNEEKDGWTKRYGSYIDPGDSFKAAATDSLKKCCSVIGFFSDIYAPEEFVDVQPQVEPKKEGADDKTMDSMRRILAKMGAKEIKQYVVDLKKSKNYTEAQKKELLKVADDYMKKLPDGVPIATYE